MFKKILYLTLVNIFTVSLFSAQVKWMTMQEAIDAQKVTPKKILIDFYAEWCGPCKIMEKQTFSHPIISELINTYYYPVKFNSEGNEKFSLYDKEFSNPEFDPTRTKKRNSVHDFTVFMNVNAIPSTVFLDETAQPITILQGALTAKELEPYLPLFGLDEYKKITTREEWESYQQKFKSKIKN